jgi:hypothetical protein
MRAEGAFGKTIARVGLLPSRQGPCWLPAVDAAASHLTSWLVGSANRLRPFFRSFQAMARSSSLVQWTIFHRWTALG